MRSPRPADSSRTGYASLKQRRRPCAPPLTSLGEDRRPSGQQRRGGRAARTRAPSGKRQAEFLAALERNPGATVPAIADEIRVPKPQAYAVARRLHEAGKIRKRRGGYALKA